MRAAIDVATDIAMVGLWDVSWDLQPLDARRADLETLAAEARAARLFFVTDDGGDTVIFVDEDVPASIREYMRPRGGWFLLQAPVGRLCFGGVEDYRKTKKWITGPESEFDVPAGDYRVRCFALDTEIPMRELATHLGEDDYRYWKDAEARSDRSCMTFVLGKILIVAIGAFVSWWLAGVLGWVTLGLTVVALCWRGRDSRYDELFDRVWKWSGGRTTDEVYGAFLHGKLALAIELRRLTDEPRPSGGFVG